MLKRDVQVGKSYRAKVSGKYTTVRLDGIETRDSGYPPRTHTFYEVTNLTTKRKMTFRSAARFLNEVGMEPPIAPNKLQENAEAAAVAVKAAPAENGTYGDKQEKLADRIRQMKDPGLDTSPHLIVEALAGTGKTTTLVEGLSILKNDWTCRRCGGTGVSSNGMFCPSCSKGQRPKLVPSPQQALVWDEMQKSQGKVHTVGFCAFNKSIATELQQRVPEGCEASTIHSMGNRAVKRAFPNLTNDCVEQYRTSNILADLLGKDIRELRRFKPNLVSGVEDLVSKCKQNLVGYSERYACVRLDGPDLDWESTLQQLADHYTIELNGDREAVFDLVPKVLERCLDVNRDGKIDYDDMIWLPVALDLNVFRYDLLLVDEAQDLNRCQQALALKAGRRLILCGDKNQAIYGFAGADSESIPRMTQILSDSDRGCVVLPLTVTRRCGKAIVAKAQEIVPEFEAHESNPAGLVSLAKYEGDKDTYHGQVTDGDMVICRVNAPLVSQCFRFLKAGRKANIQGRDIGTGLIKTIKKMKANSINELIEKLDAWYHAESMKENAKKNPSDAKLMGLKDRHDCLLTFCEDVLTIEDVIKKIQSIFTDQEGDGIRLSSGHKAKGLESHRVFILMPKGAECPHPMARLPHQKQQERNLLYVMYTRAIEELYIVR